MRLGLVRQVLATALLVALPALALAESPRKTLTLVYGAANGCPSERSFEERVLARTHPPPRRDMRRVTLRVQIAFVGARYVGRLSLLEGDGRSNTKTLSGRDCEEVADALSLVAALAIDSDESSPAADRDEAPPAPPAPPAPSAPSAPSAPADAQVQGVALERDGPRTNAGPRVGLGIGGFVVEGPAPSVLIGGTLGLEWAILGASLLRPAFGVELAAAQSLDTVTAAGTASFTWLTAQANACLLSMSLGPSIRLRACLLSRLGLLRARGSNTFQPATSSRGWLSVGGASGIELPLTSRLALLGLVGVEAPLRRDRYAFSAEEFFATPPAIVTASISVVTYFP